MCDISTEQKNAIFDEIILKRRTHRRFKEEAPADTMISGIIHAGLHAPYAAAAVGDQTDYFRRFFVVKQNSETMALLHSLVFAEVLREVADLDHAVEKSEQFRAVSTGFMNRLAMIKKMGFVPGVGTAPFYVIIAEKKGYPPVEQESLAHCLENMWLKATALGLGFQLVSVTAQMSDNEEFCKILNLEPGKWGFMGCATGYPLDELTPSVRPPAKDVTTWLP